MCCIGKINASHPCFTLRSLLLPYVPFPSRSPIYKIEPVSCRLYFDEFHRRDVQFSDCFLLFGISYYPVEIYHCSFYLFTFCIRSLLYVFGQLFNFFVMKICLVNVFTLCSLTSIVKNNLIFTYFTYPLLI